MRCGQWSSYLWVILHAAHIQPPTQPSDSAWVSNLVLDNLNLVSSKAANTMMLTHWFVIRKYPKNPVRLFCKTSKRRVLNVGKLMNLTALQRSTKKTSLKLMQYQWASSLSREANRVCLLYLSYLLQPMVTAMCLRHSGSQRTDRHQGARGIGALWEMASLWPFWTCQAILAHVLPSLKLI